MPGLVFLKLGGSLITNKAKAHSARLYMLNQACEQIARAQADDPSLRLVIGHGSGSFGHVPATRYQTRQGVASVEEWLGFVEVWQAARALNIIVMKVLHKFGIPALAFPPDAQAIASDGKLVDWDVTLIRTALQNDLVPVIYGDVLFDRIRGGTILSTEELFSSLATQLAPDRILIAGTEAGVWQDYPLRQQVIPRISPANLAEIDEQLRASEHTDVTGGMRSKVHSMMELIQNGAVQDVLIFSGIEAGNIYSSLSGRQLGTLLTRD